MEIIGLQDAIKARKEKNTFSIYEITTTPGLAERIEYIIQNNIVIDAISYSGFSNRYCSCWDCYQGGVKLVFDLNDSSMVKVQWKSVVRPNDGLADLKYTLGA